MSKTINKKNLFVDSIFDIKKFLTSNEDIDEVILDLNDLEDDIKTTVHYFDEVLDETENALSIDVLAQKEFFEKFIRLLYLRNELSPDIVYLGAKEREELVTQGHYFSIAQPFFNKLKQEHQFNKPLNDDGCIFIQRRTTLNMERKDPRDNHILYKCILPQLMYTYTDHSQPTPENITFQDYLNQINLKCVKDSLREEFDQMITFSNDRHAKYYSLYKIQATNTFSASLYNEIVGIIQKENDYSSPILNSRTTGYLVFRPYSHGNISLSAKQKYEYFYLIFECLYRILDRKVNVQYKRIITNRNSYIPFPENLVEDIVTKFGYDLPLDYSVRHFSNVKEKSIERFNSFFNEYVDSATYNRVGKEIKKDQALKGSDNVDDGNGKINNDYDAIDLRRSTGKKDLSNPKVRYKEETISRWNFTDKYTQILCEMTCDFRTSHSSISDIITKSILSKINQEKEKRQEQDLPELTVQELKELLNEVLKENIFEDRNMDKSLENSYLKTFRETNSRIINIANQQQLEYITSLQYYYIFVLLRDFYEELKSEEYKNMSTKDKIHTLKGQLFHLGYVFYCIDIYDISKGVPDKKLKITQQDFKEYMFPKNCSIEVILDFFHDTLGSLDSYYITLLEKNICINELFDKNQKEIFYEYIYDLSEQLAKYINQKEFYKVGFGNNAKAPNNYRNFISHVYHVENIYFTLLNGEEIFKFIKIIDWRVK